MATSTPQTLFSPTVTSDFDWATSTWAHGGIVLGLLAAVCVAAVLVVRAVRRSRAEAAARRTAAQDAGESPDEGLDVFTVYVTAMAMCLSVNGMWHVFSQVMHLPWIVRLVACTVLESAGLAFMKLARKDILGERPATRHVVIVWGIALLSGGLSAGASKSLLEGVIRVSLPLLAVQLCHSWMLPLPTTITLTQHEKGRRAWRYVRATRRLERSGNPLTRYVAQKRLNFESDMLTKRSLMTGDATQVLGAAERIAITEALSGLGIDSQVSAENTRQDAAGAGQLQQDVVWLLDEVAQIQDALDNQGATLGELARAAAVRISADPSAISDGPLPIPAARLSHPSETSDGSALVLAALSDGSGNRALEPAGFQMGGSDGSVASAPIRSGNPSHTDPSEVSDGSLPIPAAHLNQPSEIPDGSAPVPPTQLGAEPAPVAPPQDTVSGALTGQDGVSQGYDGQGAAGWLPAQPAGSGLLPAVAAESAAPVSDGFADGSADGSSDGREAFGWVPTHPNGSDGSTPTQPSAATHPFVAVVPEPVSDGSADGFSDGSLPIRKQPAVAAARPSQPAAQRLTIQLDQDPSETATHSRRRRSISDLVQEVEQLPPPVPTTADGLKDALNIGLPKARELRDRLLQTTASDQN